MCFFRRLVQVFRANCVSCRFFAHNAAALAFLSHVIPLTWWLTARVPSAIVAITVYATHVCDCRFFTSFIHIWAVERFQTASRSDIFGLNRSRSGHDPLYKTLAALYVKRWAITITVRNMSPYSQIDSAPGMQKRIVCVVSCVIYRIQMSDDSRTGYVSQLRRLLINYINTAKKKKQCAFDRFFKIHSHCITL